MVLFVKKPSELHKPPTSVTATVRRVLLTSLVLKVLKIVTSLKGGKRLASPNY